MSRFSGYLFREFIYYKCKCARTRSIFILTINNCEFTCIRIKMYLCKIKLELTVKLDGAIGFAQRILSNAFVRAKISRSHRTNGQFHFHFVHIVHNGWLEFSTCEKIPIVNIILN